AKLARYVHFRLPNAAQTGLRFSCPDRAGQAAPRHPFSPMPDRLDELRKQRALVQQHLTWLDHEIAAVTVTRLTLPPFAMRSSTRPPIAPTATTPSVPLGGAAKPVVVPELSEFQVNPDEVQVDTRKGCILYA